MPPGIRDFLLSMIVGVILGIFFVFFPHRSYKYVTSQRMICLILGSLMCTTLTAKLAISGGGFLASLVLSFIAITGWKIQSTSFDTIPFRRASYVIWHLGQAVLVGIIGADIDFTDWSVSRFGVHVCCLFIGVSVRSAAAYLTTLQTSFTLKERLFVVVSWLPKGTLQAAFGPMAFEQLRQKPNNDGTELAIDVLRVSVVAILFLAPFGAFAISNSGPYLLSKVTDEEYERDRELSYVRILSLQPTPVPGEQTNKRTYFT